jgi:hypothetical protein
MVWYNLCTPSLLYFSLLLYVSYNCYDINIHIVHVPSYHVHCLLDYILSIVGLSTYSCISSYSARSSVHRVSGRHCASVVLIRYLLADTPYISGHVVDHGCGTPVESFVVHSPNIGLQVAFGYEGRQALFLIFLSNIPYM